MAVTSESNRVYSARVIAHGGQLSGLGVGRIPRIVDSFRRPDPDESV